MSNLDERIIRTLRAAGSWGRKRPVSLAQQEVTMAREVRDSASLTKAEQSGAGDAFPAFLKKKKGEKAGKGKGKGKVPPAFLKGKVAK